MSIFKRIRSAYFWSMIVNQKYSLNDSISNFEKYVLSKSTMPYQMAYFASLLIENNESERALAIFRKAIDMCNSEEKDMNDQYVEAYSNYYLSLILNRNDAIDHFNFAVDLHPSNRIFRILPLDKEFYGN